MRPRTAWLLAFLVAQTAAVVITGLPSFRGNLGEPVWHHNVTLVATLGLFLLTGLVKTSKGRLWSHRAHLGIGILVWTVLATVSGFWLLYMKQELKAWELKDWTKWWHIVWSWLALWYFIAHQAVNWQPFVKALRRWSAGRAGWTYWAGNLLILIAIPLTWSAWGARTITEGNYIVLTLWTWLLLTAPTYAGWILVRRRTLTGRVKASAARAQAVRITDVWLLPAAVLANVSGFPLLWFDTKSTSLKYVAKYWHTWPSILFAILVFAHAIQWWAAMRKHWRTAGNVA